MTQTLVKIGNPVGISGWNDTHRIDGHDAVHQLTDDIAVRISAVSPSYA
jgi:hypothetical protein